MKKTALILAAGAIFACAPAVDAQSLWEHGSQQDTLAAAKRRPLDKYDQITVVVNERGRGRTSADTNADRRSRYEVDLDSFINFSAGDGLTQSNSLPLNADIDARHRQDADASTGRDSVIQEKIQAVVMEVLPNGHLIVEAKKKRQINGEVETVRLTGIVDPANVRTGQIESSLIADLYVVYEGSGSVGDAQNPGVISWLLGKIWPF